ncbi:MAG: DUF697 domain-containing protein [Angelakisella sp.]|jgi:uncharacterized protein (DUF697 family)/GTP-binding protein EngB required for normal cell division|nr:DUF697 domain-containing protein [Angelakisella sp.]
MEKKGNVLVIGNSGVGKSTLINAVLGEKQAVTGFGTSGTTKELSIHECDEVPFRIIDTVGFEFSWFKTRAAIESVKKWSSESAREGNENSQINVIWFCVDGIASKLFPETIKNLSRATSMWPHVPVLVVITKSFSIPDREKNIAMVQNAFAKQKHFSSNLKGIIPVVAEIYVLNENAYAAPEGITELIGLTNDLLPEGVQAAKIDIENWKLNRKRTMAHSIVGVATTGAVVVGAVPIPFSDALILSPVEYFMVETLAHIYDLKGNQAKGFLDAIIKAGTISAAAKAVLSALKAIPGINIGAVVLNAIIAGSIVVSLGEASIYAFEQVYLGKKTLEDIDWVTKIMESEFSNQFVEKVKEIAQKVSENADSKTIVEAVLSIFQ